MSLPVLSVENRSESSKINEDEDILVETTKEVLAASLPSALDTNEKTDASAEQPSSLTILKSSDQDQQPTTTASTLEETKAEDLVEKKSSEQLQVIGDDYPWYSNYYNIADADAKLGPLYENLSNTIRQLEQRPVPTTVEIQPEPHESIVIPEYDQKVLVDTKDTREKVHELAELSTKLTSTLTTPKDEAQDDENDFQVVHHRRRVPSSTAHDQASLSTETSRETNLSPDIDLHPVVIHGHPVASTDVLTSSSEMTTSVSSTSQKKKHKKPKKSKEETVLFDAPVLSVSEADKEKSSTVKPEVVETPTETTKVSSDINESLMSETKHETDQPSEEIKSPQDQPLEEITQEIGYGSDDIRHAIEVLNKTVDELKQTLTDTTSEEQPGEILSASVPSDLVEAHPQTDDENNDSTSSDASQLLSSSFVTIPEDTQVDTHSANQSLPAEAPKTTLPPVFESTKSEKSSSSSSAKKKKSKPKPIDQDKHKESKLQTTPLAVDEPKLESKPVPSATTKTTASSVVPKVVATRQQPEQQEEEDLDDNDGFQVVSYRRHQTSSTSHEKTSPQSSTIPHKQRSSSDTDRKQAIARPGKSSSTSTVVPTAGPTIQTRTTTKTKVETTKQDNKSSDVGLSSTSTDNDITSSSSANKIPTKSLKQNTTEPKKISSIPSEIKSSSSTVLTPSISPLITTEVESKQKPQDDEVFLESQVSSSIISTDHESDVKSEPIVSTPTKTTITPRLKAFTSPEEEEEVEDDEGFRVVHHRKRISSAPRPSRGRPPLPPQSHRQNLGHNMDNKPFVIHGRQGAGSRSIPRANTGNQMPYHRRRPERPKQDRHQMPPSHPPRPPVPKETHPMSSFVIENTTIEPIQRPNEDFSIKISDTILQSSPTDQKLFKELEAVQPTVIYEQSQISLPSVQPKLLEQNQQQVTNIEHQPVILSTEQLKVSDQKRQETKSEVKVEPLHAEVFPHVEQPKQKVDEHHPTTTQIKASVQQSPVTKEHILPTITSPSTTLTKKRASTEDEDEDGFRIVRYRKHTPSSTTPTATISKQHSYSSDGEKRPSNIPRKQVSSPSTTTSTSSASASQSTTPKTKPKRTKEGSTTTETTSSPHIYSSLTHDTNVVSSPKEQSAKRTSPKHTENVESQPTIKSGSSHSDKESKITSIGHKPAQQLKTTQVVEKVKDDSHRRIQPTESAASPQVTSADTSEELAKKPKKKHKRAKREPGAVELSTQSDDVSSKGDNLPIKKTLTPPILSSTPMLDISSTSTKTETKSDQTPVKEERLTAPSTHSPVHEDDEQIKTTSGKKHTRRRKKKSQTSEKQDQEESDLNSSTVSTTDKDSSSATGVPSKKSSAIESTSKSRSTLGDEKEDLELKVAQNNNQGTKSTESSVIPESTDQKLSLYPHSTLQSTVTPKNIPEKVTDVQFKFKKSGELIVTSQVPLESSPTEWGTVKFESDEASLSPKLELAVSTDEIPQEQLSSSKTEVSTESIVEEVPQADNEKPAESSNQTIESSETTAEADLEAYRDQTGRLRRKKPRKPVLGSNGKSEETPVSTITTSTTTTITAETQSLEETKLDHQTISEHWAAAMAIPISNVDDDEKLQSESVQQEQIYEDEDVSEASSKLDSFLPEYIRQQIKTKTSPRSSSVPDHRSKSSIDPSTSTVDTHSAHTEFPPTLHRSASTDTSENESRKHVRESHDDENFSTEDSQSHSASNQIEQDKIPTSSSSPSSLSGHKKKQRPKMLKKDVEAKRLLTHEFDDTPFTITELQAAPSTDEGDKSLFTSIRNQFSSAISTLTDSFTSAKSTPKPSSTDELKSSPKSDEPVPSIQEPIPVTQVSIPTETSTTVTKKKSSTHSPRKRSKRDSGPDYEKLISSPDGVEQTSADIKATTTVSTSADKDQTDLTKSETHKHQARQRTASGRQIHSTQEENEQQAILADDEEDDDFVTKPTAMHGTGSGTHVPASSESVIEQQDPSTTTASAQNKRHKRKSGTEETEPTEYVTDEEKSDKEDISSSDQQSPTSNEKLRPVQGFHSFTPNKYQYNQYEEGPTGSNELSISSITTTTTSTTSTNQDEIFARGFGLWLKQNKESQPSSSIKNEEQPETASSLTRAMQSLIIQPVETDDEEEEEEDSWNGPRAIKPTYTTGIRAEKQIHSTSGYSINHPRSITVSPWMMPKSTDNTYQDDSSKFDPDDEDDSINDASDKLQSSHTNDTQPSTQEGRQMHLSNLADLTFQPNISHLSSSASSLSSAAKWNETALRTDDNTQPQTNFTEDDVQRCLGENFYRESLAVDPLQAEKLAITGLTDLIVKPSQSLDETDNDEDLDDDNQKNRNNNNNNPSINFDEWGQFIDYNDNQQMFQSSESTSSRVQQHILTSYECSYARQMDNDTLITDADRSHVMDYVPHSYENDRQRYGDFSCINDDSNISESMTDSSSLSTNSNSQIPNRQRPSQTFQRWRNQSNRDRQESNSNVTMSTENQNDDEIFVSHTDGGLSRRVRPTQ